MKALEKIIEIAATAGVWLAGFAILGISIVGGIDVASTFFLGRPVPSTVESTEILMVIGAFSGLALLHLRRSHIAVNLLYDRSSRPVQRGLDIFTLVLMTIYFGLIAWRGWIAAIHSVAVREYSTGIMAIPVYPSKIALALGMSLAVLCCLFDIAKGGHYRQTQPARPEDEPI